MGIIITPTEALITATTSPADRLASLPGPASAGLFLARVVMQRYRHSMVDDPDIRRAANFLVKRHGVDAGLRRTAGAIWTRILEAVTELSRTKPAEGERVN